jgi:hypothetical protein
MENEAAQAEVLTETEREMKRLRSENDMLTKAGIIEVAVRNPSVSEYMEHWEARALKAEDRAAGLESRHQQLTLALAVSTVEMDVLRTLVRRLRSLFTMGIAPRLDEVLAEMDTVLVPCPHPLDRRREDTSDSLSCILTPSIPTSGPDGEKGKSE